METPPTWLQCLRPTEPPCRRRFSTHSDESVWYVSVSFEAYAVRDGQVLTRSETWNGKPLLKAETIPIVGEIELVARLRKWFGTSQVFWTAGIEKASPPQRWAEWTLGTRRLADCEWLHELDSKIRRGDDLLAGNHRGLPDVMVRDPDSKQVYCVEYKGPQRSNPKRCDRTTAEQARWLQRGLKLKLLLAENYAVAHWVPSDAAEVILRRQFVVSKAAQRRRQAEGESR